MKKRRVRVAAIMDDDGIYVGVLKAMVRAEDGRTWCCTVEVDGVISPAIHFDAAHGAVRRGFRPGEEIQTCASKIQHCGDAGISYKQALEAAIDFLQWWLKRNAKRSRYADSQRLCLKAYRQALDSEIRYLRTGQWVLKPLAAPATQPLRRTG